MYISKTINSDSNQVIGFNVLIRGGSNYETKQNNGISHLLEHLIVKKIQQVDGWVRPYYIDQLVGVTYKDRIEFEGRILATDKDQLEDIVKTIFSNVEFTKEEFEAEKQVILEELIEEEESEDYQYQRQESEWIYGKSSLALPTGGTVKSIKRLSLQDVQQWRSSLLSEENCFVSFVGLKAQKQIDINLEDKNISIIKNTPIFVQQRPGSQLIIDDGKEQVSYSESWYSNPMDFKLTVQTEFLTQMLQDYFYYKLRENGLCYRFDVSTIVHAEIVELTITSWSDKSKLNKIQEIISSTLQSGSLLNIEDLELYKTSFVGNKKLEGTDEQLQAHHHNWYKAFCGVDYDLDVLIKIVSEIKQSDINHLVGLFGMSSQGVRVLQGNINK
jgi:predicted Zn-dependent peptidase